MKRRERSGFAGMDREKQREIARRGGRAAHQKGTAHQFTADEARAAGRKGGVSVSRDREHMSRIGRAGGLRSRSGERRAVLPLESRHGRDAGADGGGAPPRPLARAHGPDGPPPGRPAPGPSIVRASGPVRRWSLAAVPAGRRLACRRREPRCRHAAHPPNSRRFAMDQRPSPGPGHPAASGGSLPPATRTVRILFVSHSDDDVALVLHELRRGGFTPDPWVVRDADAMRDALAEVAWDLVVGEYAAGDFGALAALEVLRASGQDPPFIVVSGHIGEEPVVACMKAGASDFLARDDLVRLVPAVERDLREADQRRRGREAVEALRASEERYRLLVENSADMITLHDDGGYVTFVSPSVTRMLGYPPEEMIGHRLREFAHPGDAPVLVAAMEGALAHGSTPLLTGLRLRHRDGSWRIIEGSAARLVRPDGSAGIVAIGRDVTGRVELEEQLHQAQKMEAVGRLAGGVAHDFNNLLTVILGYSDLLLEQLDEDPLLFQEVDEIKRAADRAATLTQQLLAFSRKQVLEPAPGGPRRRARRHVRHAAAPDRRGRRADAQALGRRWRSTRVDPAQVEQVVMNLAVNARDAMPQGGRLAIETANVELRDPYSTPPRRGARGLRDARGDRHRPRHGRRHAGAPVRAVLHHQGAGQGHGARALDRLRHRAAERRHRARHQRARARQHASASTCRRWRRRPGRRRSRRGPTGCAAARPSCWWRTSRWCATW